ncbi:hypothetical protein [Mesorhizobium sp. IMUNJ 23232]|uniref:hypothetical protein n=1 Tax=Mesorhizobium sp. IMUNJ 23232 TaxID=3376064 RepID=UPI0037A0CD68
MDELAGRDALDAGEAETAYVFAPSLRALPKGLPLVMATLPIVDWNAVLLQALGEMDPVDGRRCYAAVMMIDPFTLWEDLADLLSNKGFAGVINFPPAVVAEGSPASTSAENPIEIERLKWFADSGMRLAFMATSAEEVANAEARLPGRLDAIVHMPAEKWEYPVSERIELRQVVSKEVSSALPVWTVASVGSPTATPISAGS